MTLARISGRLATAPRVGVDPDAFLRPRTDLLVNRVDYVDKQGPGMLVGKTVGFQADNTLGMRTRIIKVKRTVKPNSSGMQAVGISQPVQVPSNPAPWWTGGTIQIGSGGMSIKTATPYRRVS